MYPYTPKALLGAGWWLASQNQISKSEKDKVGPLVRRKDSFLGSPSQRGTALSHTTLPSLRMQEMVCEPCVLTNPSSHRKEMELPSWRFSPKRFPFTGTPGSGHSLWRKAARKQRWGWRGELSAVAEKSKGMKSKHGLPTTQEKWRLVKIIYWRQLYSGQGI